MRVVVAHRTSWKSACNAVEKFVEGLAKQTFPGVTVEDLQAQWDENRLNFSFHARKGFFGAAIEGVVTVDDNNVTVEADLPAVVSESDAENAVRKQLKALFR